MKNDKEEAHQGFSFIKMPKFLFEKDEYKKLSFAAKHLYAFLLDRERLSVANNWRDDNGRPYVVCTVKNAQETLGISNKTVSKLFAELSRAGLIERKVMGNNKPSIIYIKMNPEVNKLHPRECNIYSSGCVESTCPDVKEVHTNKNNINKNKSNNNSYLILEGIDKRNFYREYINETISFEALINDYPEDKRMIEEISELMLDTICSKKTEIKIAGEDRPKEVVKGRLLKLNYMHIVYVIDCIKNNTVEVKNIKQYMLATLYNAPVTMESYYEARFAADKANGLI